MTEDEAKTKACFKTYAPPAVGTPSPTHPGHAIGERWGGFQQLCIGSACMAFRSAVTAHELLKVGETPARDGLVKKGKPVRGKGERWQEWERTDVHCGLAGTP